MTLLSPTSLILVGLIIPEFILFLRFSRARRLRVPSVYLWKRMKPGRPRLGWRKISRALEFVLLASGTGLLGLGLAMPVPEGEKRPVALFIAAAPETHDAKALSAMKESLRAAIANVPRHRSVALILPDGSVVGPTDSRGQLLRDIPTVHRSRSASNVFSTAARFGEPLEISPGTVSNSYGIIGIDKVAGRLAALVYNYGDTSQTVSLIFQSDMGSVSIENKRLCPRLNVIEVPEVDTGRLWTLSLVPGDSYSPDDRFYISPSAPADIKVSLIVNADRIEFLKSALDAIASSGLPLGPGKIFTYASAADAIAYVTDADFQSSIILTDIESIDALKRGSKVVWLKSGGKDEIRTTPQDKMRVGSSYIHTAYAGTIRAVSCVEAIASVRDIPVAGLEVIEGKIVATFGFDAGSRGFLISPAFPILLSEIISKIHDWEPVEAAETCGEPFRAKHGLKFDYARMTSPVQKSMGIVNGEVFTPDAPGIYEISVNGYVIKKCVNVCAHPEARQSTGTRREWGIQIYDMCAYAGVGLVALEVVIFLLRTRLRKSVMPH